MKDNAVVLEARGLTRTFTTGDLPVHALRGVDLALEPGSFTAIMGPSGCGKSTLLHLLGGLDRPTAGEIHLAGSRVDQLSEARWSVLRRREIGFVFQFFNLIGNLTAADNIELPSLLVGTSHAEARRRSQELLGELGIGDKAGAIPARLSGGQQQRVALARALVNNPTLLLADEPTGNLDSESTRDVLTLLQRLNAGGQTILLVTHDARVASIAGRVITMRDGTIVDDTRLSSDEPSAELLAHLVRLEA
ncbi:MAG TPA: ABC transporter ATP-binding protein [Thermomicrobiales bacterium]|nr:ABC transporter ATP-binding protein [Thermomicrobiales bacterium]